jgi:hypothetical protein
VDELVLIEFSRRTGRQLMDFQQPARDQNSVLVSLATLGAAAFHEQRRFTSKAGYYKKYLSIESAVMPRWSLIPAALLGN